MKKFVFPLAGLQRIREFQKMTAIEKVQQAAHQRINASDALNRNVEEIERLDNFLEYSCHVPTSPSVLQSAHQLRSKLVKQQQDLNTILEQARNREQQTIAHFKTCHTQCKVLERLCQKSKDEHTKETILQEEHEAAEFFNASWGRGHLAFKEE